MREIYKNDIFVSLLENLEKKEDICREIETREANDCSHFNQKSEGPSQKKFDRFFVKLKINCFV